MLGSEGGIGWAREESYPVPSVNNKNRLSENIKIVEAGEGKHFGRDVEAATGCTLWNIR